MFFLHARHKLRRIWGRVVAFRGQFRLALADPEHYQAAGVRLSKPFEVFALHREEGIQFVPAGIKLLRLVVRFLPLSSAITLLIVFTVSCTGAQNDDDGILVSRGGCCLAAVERRSDYRFLGGRKTRPPTVRLCGGLGHSSQRQLHFLRFPNASTPRRCGMSNNLHRPRFLCQFGKY